MRTAVAPAHEHDRAPPLAPTEALGGQDRPIRPRSGRDAGRRSAPRGASNGDLASGSFPDFTRVGAAQLAAELNTTLPGVQAVDDAGGVLIESTSVGADSCVQIVDGTARAVLGFTTNGWADPCHSRPLLGISLGAGQVMDKDIMALRRCNDCGANECLVRTFDAAPAHLDGTHLMAHRQAVNSLAEHCKSCGWSHPDVAEHHAAELARPRDVHAQVLDQPVILPRFVHPVVGVDVRPEPDDGRG